MISPTSLLLGVVLGVAVLAVAMRMVGSLRIVRELRADRRYLDAWRRYVREEQEADIKRWERTRREAATATPRRRA